MREIFSIKGFTSFVIVLFLNSFTDLGHKIIMQNLLFKQYSGTEQIIYISIINLLIILPFILLFTPSGWIGDRFAKNKVMVYSAAAAIPITAMITLSYYQGWFEAAFVFTFILAAQSVIYSPAKYGYIKEIVGKDNLPTGNSVVQSTTIISILVSSFFYSILFENSYIESNSLSTSLTSIAPLGFVLILLSCIEFAIALTIPKKSDGIKSDFNFKNFFMAKDVKDNLKELHSKEVIWLSIIGVSIFWGISQAVIAIFPSYAKDYVGITNTIVVQGIIAFTAIGIIAGSLYAGKLSKNYIEVGLVPVSSIGISILLMFIPITLSKTLLSMEFFGLGFFGGMFLIPLNSIMQFNAKDEEIGMTMAGNNFMNSFIMVTFLILTTLSAIYQFNSIPQFYALSIIAILGTLYALSKTPQAFIRYLIARLISTKYELTVEGIKNIPSTGGVLLLGNHTSWLDWAVLQIASPRNIRFVMDRNIYEKWFLKWFLDIFNVIPISSKSAKNSIEQISEYLRQGEIVCLFPEGFISRNGQLLEFKKGFELVYKNEDLKEIPIIPFYIRGLWGSAFSGASEKLSESLKDYRQYREVSVVFGNTIEDINNKNAEFVKKEVSKLSILAWKIFNESFDPLHISFLKTAKRFGSDLAAADSTGTKLSFTKLLTSVILFRNMLKNLLKGKNIGILMPSTVGGIISNLSVLTLGKVAVNINYTSNTNSIISSLELAEVEDIIVSEKFLVKLKSKGFDLDLVLKNKNLIVLEDLKLKISKIDAITTLLLTKFLPTKILELLYFKKVDINETAVILFSSGSEGVPKGVELTHKNVLSNVKQISSVINPNNKDIIMGTLPLFHAMGLTVTTMLPVIEGIPVVCHPDPTDGQGVAKLVAEYGGTILIGTSTFLRLYLRNKKIHPLMFDSLRIVVSGAEKLSEDVRIGFKERFGKTVYEGYGATETTPVACVNIPDYLYLKDLSVHVGSKIGSVGLTLPGSNIKIIDPNRISEFRNNIIEELPINESGMILIGGEQVMKGYLKNKEKTNEVILTDKTGQKWYITGDKGNIDNDGFLTIVDRYSRFVKIGGEMISLTAVEEEIKKHLNDENIEICAVNLPDEKKGEKIIVAINLYENKDLDLNKFKSELNSKIENKLMIPNDFFETEILKLGSGKIDFKSIKEVVKNNYKD